MALTDPGEALRNDRVRGVRVDGAVTKPCDADRKRALCLRRGPVEFDAVSGASRYGETFAAEPIRNRFYLGGRRPEAPDELIAGEPFVIVGRLGILLLGQQRFEVFFVAQREANLHLQVQIRAGLAQLAKLLCLGRMIAREHRAVIGMAGIGKEQNPESPKNNYREQRHENRAEAVRSTERKLFCSCNADQCAATECPEATAPPAVRVVPCDQAKSSRHDFP